MSDRKGKRRPRSRSRPRAHSPTAAAAAPPAARASAAPAAAAAATRASAAPAATAPAAPAAATARTLAAPAARTSPAAHAASGTGAAPAALASAGSAAAPAAAGSVVAIALPAESAREVTSQRCRPVGWDAPRPRRSPSAPPHGKELELSPRSSLHSDIIAVAELQKRGVLSQSLLAHIAMFLNDQGRELDRARAGHGPSAAMDINTTQLTSARRPRTSDGASELELTTPKRLCAKPLPQRDPRLFRRTDTAQAPPAVPIVTPPVSTTTTTFADALRTAGPSSAPQNVSTTAPPVGPNQSAQPKPRIPPLIVEELPNWTIHFRALKERLGYPPNARPLGKGMRFSPISVDEYRVIQKYLSELEKNQALSWFSYALPSDLSKKVAIRGLPASTNPEEIIEALAEKGFQAEYVRPIKARQGRPGCIFYAILSNSPNLLPAIYEVSELLYMTGITIEAWRGKRGLAQCHRCQAFRHSSHGCHRRMACVRCGEEHFARDCPRPQEEPATCANCGGPHPANHSACPQYRKEVRNKRAGTIALTKKQNSQQRTVPPVAPVAVNTVPAERRPNLSP